MPPIDIDAEGDVVLVCGEGKDRQRLRVCSKILSTASPIYKSMLSPRFREGTQLRHRGSIELQLFEDHAASMTTICRIAHLQNDLVPDFVPIPDLLEICRLCDKHDLRALLSTQTTVWVTTALESIPACRYTHSGDRQRLLVIAYNLGNAAVFDKVGREIITKEVDFRRSEASKPWAPEVEKGFDQVFDALFIERRRVQDWLSDEIADLMENEATRRDEGFGCTPDCIWAEKYLHFVVEHLRRQDLWPTRVLRSTPLDSISTALEDTDWAEYSLNKSNINQCGGGDCCGAEFDFNRPDHISRWLKEMKQKGQDMIKPLCYECMWRGEILSKICKHGKPREKTTGS